MADELQGMVVKVGITDSLFTEGIGKINKSMTLLQSEFKASSESLKGFGSSTDQLKNKADYLGKAIEMQKAKIQQLKDGYEKAKSETGQFSNATTTAGTKVNNAVAYLAKMQNELKSVDTELNKTNTEVKKVDWKDSFSKAGDGIDNTKNKLAGFKTALLGITTAVAGGFGLMKFTEGAINAGDSAYTLSQKLHVSATEAVGLNRILSITDTDSKPLISTLTKLDKGLESAGDKGNATTKMLKEYGVSLTDAKGKLIPMNSQLEALAIAYKKASDAGNEEAFSAEVLGAKGQELIPLLENYTEAKEEASKVKGIGIDPEQAHQTAEELKVLKLQVSATSGVMAKALIPVVQQILPPLIKLFQDLTEQVKVHKVEIDKFIQSTISIGKELGETVMPIVKALFTFVAEHGELVKNTVIALGVAWAGLSVVKGIISGITGAMKIWENYTRIMTTVQKLLNLEMSLNPIGLVVIAIGLLVGALVVAYNSSETFRNGVNKVFNSVKDTALWVFNGIKDFLSKWGLDILTVFFPILGVPLQIIKHWSEIKEFFKNLKDDIKEKIHDMFNFEMPHIKLPHLKITGSFDILKGEIPSVGVSWYAKGGIFNSPSVIGVGEAGNEAVLPIDRLDDLMAKAIQKSGGTNNSQPIFITVISELDGREIARSTAKYSAIEQEKLRAKQSRAMGGVY